MSAIYDLFVIMAVGWGIVGLSFVLSSPIRSSGVAWPGVLLIVASILPLIDVIGMRFVFGGNLPPALRALDRCVGYLIGPLLYYYVKVVLQPGAPRPARFLPHLIPFVVCLSLCFVPSLGLLSIPPNGPHVGGFLGPPVAASPPAPRHLIWPPLLDVGKFVSMVVYGGFVSGRLVRGEREVADYYADYSPQSRVRRVRNLLASYLVVVAAACMLIVYYAMTKSGNAPRIALANNAPLILFVFEFVFFLRRQTLPGDVLALRNGTAVMPAAVGGTYDGGAFHGDDPKYLRSGLSQRDTEEVYRLLLDHLAGSRAYLDPELSLPVLAEGLEVSRHHLSQVINIKTKGNFYQLINGFRIEEFKRRVEAGEHEVNTLAAVALGCGFNSYTTFYNTFKRTVGTTPRAFIAGHAAGDSD